MIKIKLIINEDIDRIEEKYDDCHTYFLFKIKGFRLIWFLDTGKWFINFDCPLFHYRISSEGNIFHKK